MRQVAPLLGRLLSARTLPNSLTSVQFAFKLLSPLDDLICEAGSTCLTAAQSSRLSATNARRFSSATQENLDSIIDATKDELVGASRGSAVSLWQPCRLQAYYQQILYRELILRSSEFCNRILPRIPYLEKVEIEIMANKTELGADLVEKRDMLLYGLALEHIVMAPVEYVSDNIAYNKGKVLGVKAVLTDVKKYEFLEKLIYLVLPSQFAFVGAPYPTLVRPYKLKLTTMPRHATTFEVGTIVAYPDYEDNFDMFERLKGMQVTITVANSLTADLAVLLLNGFGLPTLPKPEKKAVWESNMELRRGRGKKGADSKK